MCLVDVTWRSKNAWYDSFWRSGIQTSLLATFRRPCPWCSAFSILCILPRNRHIGPTATRIFQFIQEEAFRQILEHVDGWNVCFLRPYHIDMHYFLSSSTGWRWVCLETPTLCGGWEDCGTAGSRNRLGREKSHGSTAAKGKDQHALTNCKNSMEDSEDKGVRIVAELRKVWKLLPIFFWHLSHFSAFFRLNVLRKSLRRHLPWRLVDSLAPSQLPTADVVGCSQREAWKTWGGTRTSPRGGDYI